MSKSSLLRSKHQAARNGSLKSRRRKLKLEICESRQLLSATMGLPAVTGEEIDFSAGLCRFAEPAAVGFKTAGDVSAGKLQQNAGAVAGEVPHGDTFGPMELDHDDDHVYPAEPQEAIDFDRAYWAAWTAAGGGEGDGEWDGIVPLSDTFLLHSRPSATKKIFLDYDGFTARGTPWNGSYGDPIVSPAYDPAGNGPAFTNAELASIQQAWHRVAEDFAPFDVDVTTEDPGEAALINSGGGDEEYGIRVVITVDDFASCGCGGFAYINSFNWGYNSAGATDTPAYVFNTSAMTVAAAVTHEVGHALGLSHDGTTASNPVQPSSEYYNGHGSGETGWGPIMGSGYYRNVSSWDLGEYIGTSNGTAGANYGRGPDDLQVITNNNGFSYRADDHSDSRLSATEVDYVGANAADPTLVDVEMYGVIERTNDVDYIKFQTGEGVIDLVVNSYISKTYVPNGAGGYDNTYEDTFFTTSWGNNQGSNLDIVATLYDSLGNVVATSNPAGLSASFSGVSVSAGVYYISVDGTGFGNPTDPTSPTGYTQYASLGQYMVQGTIVETGGPVAIATSPDIRFASANPLTITVSYTDRNGVNLSTLGTGDLRVVGPNGFAELPEFVSAYDPGNGGAVIATYSLLPPGGDWEESDNGTYTISLQANEVADVDGNYSDAAVIGAFDVDILPILGPDGFGYTGSQVPYQFTDISTTGALVLNGEDDATVLIQPSGFEFSAYGKTFTEVYVSSNGIITFGGEDSFYLNSDLANDPLPITFAAYWDDLAAPSGSGVYWQLMGSGDDQQLVLQWKSQYFNSVGEISFQVVLDESDMSMTAYYRDLLGNSSGQDEGLSATVGIKDAGPQGANRILAAFNDVASGYIGSGLALRFAVENSAPVDIQISASQIAENLAAGAVVGTFMAIDPDATDTHTFELVAGTGDSDNASFEIVGNQLRTKAAFDFETQSSFNVRVKATDDRGASVEKEFVVDVIDLIESATVVVGDGTAQRSRVDRLVVTFDGAVDLEVGAFVVNKRGVGGGAVPTAFSTQVDGLGRTVATVTFSGGFTRANSPGILADGNYDLRIDATKVKRNGWMMDGDQDGVEGGDITFGTQSADKFFAFYGDANGDRSVTFPDFLQFRAAYGTTSGQAAYRPVFDFTANGNVNFSDFLQFRSRYSSSLGFE